MYYYLLLIDTAFLDRQKGLELVKCAYEKDPSIERLKLAGIALGDQHECSPAVCCCSWQWSYCGAGREGRGNNHSWNFPFCTLLAPSLCLSAKLQSSLELAVTAEGSPGCSTIPKVALWEWVSTSATAAAELGSQLFHLCSCEHSFLFDWPFWAGGEPKLKSHLRALSTLSLLGSGWREPVSQTLWKWCL